MAGLYFHIPFCASKCHYCNFFSLASLKYKDQIVSTILKEIELKSDLCKEEIKTVYFGGGTPSILNKNELNKIFNSIHKHFSISKNAEITLETNPEDVNIDNLISWKQLGINRLSLGLQSLNNQILQKLNRLHSAEQSLKSVKMALDFGFSNISIDLIFGIPGQSNLMFTHDLMQMIELGIPHISAYALTVEPKTALDILIRKKQYPSPDENQTSEQFYIASDFLIKHGYEHYEISNYAKNKLYAQHNTNYWKGEKYIGFGPSAHSYFLNSRSWNPSSIKEYVQQIEEKKLFFEEEMLDKKTQFNEYIMLGLRTQWGIDIEYVKRKFPEFLSDLTKQLEEETQKGNLLKTDSKFTLNSSAKIFTDSLTSSLFV